MILLFCFYGRSPQTRAYFIAILSFCCYGPSPQALFCSFCKQVSQTPSNDLLYVQRFLPVVVFEVNGCVAPNSVLAWREGIGGEAVMWVSSHRPGGGPSLGLVGGGIVMHCKRSMYNTRKEPRASLSGKLGWAAPTA